MIDPEKIEQVETIYGTFNCWRDDLTTEQFKRYSAHTRNELAMLSHCVRPGDNVLDIGAHIGSFALPFARFMRGQGKIYSFEANPDNYVLLEKNIEENQLQDIIVPCNAVVSSDQQSFSMQLPDVDNTGTHYFVPDSNSSEAHVGVNIDSWHKQFDNPPAIHLIKIDVEGAEVSVIDSCVDVINTYRPTLYIEIVDQHLQRFGSSADDIDQRLKPFGYHYFRNVGKRNSTDDSFEIARMESVSDGGQFFDLLAIHPDSDRYP